jgi:serine/threonine protein kinase
MATGNLPSSEADDRQTVRQIRRGKLKLPRTMDRAVESLIKPMAKLNPNERPTVNAVLEDPFFDEVRISTECRHGKRQSTDSCRSRNMDAQRAFGLW